MTLKSYSCKGCTNLTDMITPWGDVGQYCGTGWQKKPKGKKWMGDELVCLDYTAEPSRQMEIPMWLPPTTYVYTYDDDGMPIPPLCWFWERCDKECPQSFEPRNICPWYQGRPRKQNGRPVDVDEIKRRYGV